MDQKSKVNKISNLISNLIIAIIALFLWRWHPYVGAAYIVLIILAGFDNIQNQFSKLRK